MHFLGSLWQSIRVPAQLVHDSTSAVSLWQCHDKGAVIIYGWGWKSDNPAHSKFASPPPSTTAHLFLSPPLKAVHWSALVYQWSGVQLARGSTGWKAWLRRYSWKNTSLHNIYLLFLWKLEWFVRKMQWQISLEGYQCRFACNDNRKNVC